MMSSTESNQVVDNEQTSNLDLKNCSQSKSTCTSTTTSTSIMSSSVLFQVTNEIVEVYLKNIIRPFLQLHESFYTNLNTKLRTCLDDHSDNIPTWFTANFITYARTLLVIPCILLLARGHHVLPSLIVILVDFCDFLDGVVARYWKDWHDLQASIFIGHSDSSTITTGTDATVGTAGTTSLASSDKNSFPNQLTNYINSNNKNNNNIGTESSTLVSSWTVNHRTNSYGGFIDAICDKAFVIPCWIHLLSTVHNPTHIHTLTSTTSTFIQIISYLTLWSLILAETTSACIRFKAYYTDNSTANPIKVQGKGLDFSTSAVKADHIGKAKQTFEMVGTAFYILPFTFTKQFVGLLLLVAAVPLAYESVRRKIVRRVIYIQYSLLSSSSSSSSSSFVFDYHVLKFWMQAKALGSKLIIGISEPANTSTAHPNSTSYTCAATNLALNACACSSVDGVIVSAPTIITSSFLQKYGIHYVLIPSSSITNTTTTVGVKDIDKEVLTNHKCLIIGKDGNARPSNSLDSENSDCADTIKEDDKKND